MIVDLPLLGNYLQPNGLGGYVISSSAVTSWSRCQLQRYYELRARKDPEAPQPLTLSATVYGSVIHYALQVMELAMHEGKGEEALALGLKTWEHYWHPVNIRQLPGLQPPDEWMARDSWGGLRERGKITLKDHYSILTTDKSDVLALEYRFAVPLEIRGVTHTITGAIDRLAIRQHYNKPYVSLDDNKSGKQPSYLRYHMQGTVYGFASTLPEFWTGWAESGLGSMETFPVDVMERLEGLFDSYGYRLHEGQAGDKPLGARRFRWINLKELKMADGGWRSDRDYQRFAYAADAYIRSSEAGIYSVNTTGEICRYCAFQATCAGCGLPPVEEGQPSRKVHEAYPVQEIPND